MEDNKQRYWIRPDNGRGLSVSSKPCYPEDEYEYLSLAEHHNIVSGLKQKIQTCKVALNNAQSRIIELDKLANAGSYYSLKLIKKALDMIEE